ncbi:MAG: restriction endonuclease subunit S [Magnetococcales bacterium]|nr:restriction endonuclease subunit S [Magnetococcales bacterium]
MSQPPLIDIRPDHWGIVQGILQRHVPDREVWAFGSRAKWTAKPYSDLDLAILGDDSLSLGILAGLEEDFSESALPFKVDVVDWATTSVSFRKIIEAGKVVVQEGRREQIVGSGWHETTWGEVATLEYGKAIRGYQNASGEFPVYGTNGLIGWHNESLCHSDGVVIGRKGAYRGVHYSNKPFFVIDTAFYLKPKGLLHIKWAYYCLLTYDINGMDSGSAIPSTSRDEFYKLPVILPGLSEQERVSSILGALDDRIALLRETNATLEAMAQAIFKSWFVDFDPVHSKQQGRIPEGMDEATAALFPDSFEESELGPIPKGWRVGTLADLATLNPESWTAKRHPAQVAYIDLANTKDNVISTITHYPFGEAPSRARRVLRDGDTIVGTVRPGNRSFALIYKPSNDLTASTGFAVLRPTRISYTEFIFLSVTQGSSIEYLAHVADGGAYPAVRPEVVMDIQCVLPDEVVMQSFHDLIMPILASVSEQQQQSQTLAAIRDALLPKLMSGKLRVQGADHPTGGKHEQ